MRTVAGAVDLFESLLSPATGPEILSDPPIKFLAVDDDPVSRHTISFALKRALTAPDLAENGPAGLSLAEAAPYDVIFLDVQMPEMDGFEVCSRIHQTGANATTPVVFVTCSSDFNSRAQSTLVGGNDLIGKPFLTFEITVKALTLALRTRLAASRVKARSTHARTNKSSEARDHDNPNAVTLATEASLVPGRA
jgi:two-component system response regulator ResD